MNRISSAIIMSLALMAGGCASKHISCKPATQSLQQYLSYKKNSGVLIMAHRNAPTPDFAENALSTMQYTYQHFPCAIQEIDIRMSKDSMLLLLHDATLERTTTGSGPVNQLTWQQLQQVSLKNEKGNVLPNQHIPTAEDILNFVKGRMMVALDVKPGTDLKRVMPLVEKTGTLNNVLVICYTIVDAQLLNKRYPTLKLALGFNDEASIAAIEQAGIPYNNILALTPQKLQPESFYKKIHSMGIIASVGSYGNVDTLGFSQSYLAYKKILHTGGDILCTDSIFKMAKMFK